MTSISNSLFSRSSEAEPLSSEMKSEHRETVSNSCRRKNPAQGRSAVRTSKYIMIRHAIVLGILGILANVALSVGMVLKLLGFEPASWRVGCWTATQLWAYIQDHMEGHLNAKPSMTFSGDLDKVQPGEGAVVIANHQGYADYYLIHGLAQRLPSAQNPPPPATSEKPPSEQLSQPERPAREKLPGRGMLGSCRYFAKKSLVWQVLVFGWVYVVGMILVSRNWTTDASHIRSAFARVKENKHACWIVSYLEGTRLSSRKLKQSVKFARKEGKPAFERVLYPRTKGFVTTIQELRNSHIKYVYDLTLAYQSPPIASPAKGQKPSSQDYGSTSPQRKPAVALLNGPTRAPGLSELLSVRDISAAGYAFHVDLRRVAIADLPEDEDGLKAWVEDARARKDALLRTREWA